MILNTLGVIATLISFLCVLLAVFLLNVPTPRKLPNRLLAVFLLLTAVELSAYLWVNAQNQFSWLNGLRHAVGCAQMAVFWGFYQASCYADFRLRTRHVVHLLPLFVGLLLILPGSQLPWSSDASASVNLVPAEMRLFDVMAHALYYGYMVAVMWTLWQFYRHFKAQHASGRSETWWWLTQLALASFVAHTLIFLREVLASLMHASVFEALRTSSAFIALAITTWIALKSLLQPDLFRTVDRNLLVSGEPELKAPPADLERLTAFMIEHRPYLDAKLSLATLADQLAMVPRDVSELLNQSLGVHFFDFINRYRVQHAQDQLLAQPTRSVTDILFDAGFNSKSSFNAAFRKHAGMTPSAYRAAKRTD